jgi:hypothetical protein
MQTITLQITKYHFHHEEHKRPVNPLQTSQFAYSESRVVLIFFAITSDCELEIFFLFCELNYFVCLGGVSNVKAHKRSC